jgi:hypothetical protein
MTLDASVILATPDRAPTLAATLELLSHQDADGGTPVSIIEAATLALPVASTLHAGIPEILPPEAALARPLSGV